MMIVVVLMTIPNQPKTDLLLKVTFTPHPTFHSGYGSNPHGIYMSNTSGTNNDLNCDALSQYNAVMLRLDLDEDETLEAGTYSYTSYDYFELYTVINEGATIDCDEYEFNYVVADWLTGITESNVVLNITAITDDTITFEFTITREDGELITGNYEGAYTAF